ncbi:MAG: hypothetical protein ACFFDN_02065 [Candidatus Hodarchaeota archaeon]
MNNIIREKLKQLNIKTWDEKDVFEIGLKYSFQLFQKHKEDLETIILKYFEK